MLPKKNVKKRNCIKNNFHQCRLNDVKSIFCHKHEVGELKLKYKIIFFNM